MHSQFYRNESKSWYMSYVAVLQNRSSVTIYMCYYTFLKAHARMDVRLCVCIFVRQRRGLKRVVSECM